MVFLNKFGYMVLMIGNKFEMLVGYVMFYGDMCGGYNVFKDIYKMCVFVFVFWCN